MFLSLHVCIFYLLFLCICLSLSLSLPLTLFTHTQVYFPLVSLLVFYSHTQDLLPFHPRLLHSQFTFPSVPISHCVPTTYLSRTYRVSLEPTHPYTHKCKQCLYPPCLPPSVCVWHKNFTHVPPLLLLAAVCSLHKGLANFICLSSSPRLAFCHILREIDAICRKKFHLKQLVISTL